MTYAYCHYFKLYGPCKDVFEAEHEMYLRWRTLRVAVSGAPEDLGIFEYWTVKPELLVAHITPIRTSGGLWPSDLVSDISKAYPNVCFECSSIRDEDRLDCYLFKDGDTVPVYAQRIDRARSRFCNEYFYADAYVFEMASKSELRCEA